MHGDDLEFFPKDVIPSLVGNLKSFNGLTILILGETGVGKSTFINGFANYLQFQTLVGHIWPLSVLSCQLHLGSLL